MRFPTLSRPVRRLTLVVHVVVAVGWLGLDAVLLTLGATALLTADPQLAQACYLAMDAAGGVLLIPVSLLALGTGLVLSLGTAWGLARHRWVLTKFALTSVAVLMSIFVLRGYLDRAASSPVDRLDGLDSTLVLAPSVALVVYLTTTTLAVLKPWGRTRWARRASQGGQVRSPIRSGTTF